MSDRGFLNFGKDDISYSEAGQHQEQELPPETMFSPTKYAGIFPKIFQVSSHAVTETPLQALQEQGGVPNAAVPTSVPAWGHRHLPLTGISVPRSLPDPQTSSNAPVIGKLC